MSYDILCFLDAISAANPRVIDDARARKLSNDLKRSTYYETCSTYGLNVERVFQDGEILDVLTSVSEHALCLFSVKFLSTGVSLSSWFAINILCSLRLLGLPSVNEVHSLSFIFKYRPVLN